MLCLEGKKRPSISSECKHVVQKHFLIFSPIQFINLSCFTSSQFYNKIVIQVFVKLTNGIMFVLKKKNQESVPNNKL